MSEPSPLTTVSITAAGPCEYENISFLTSSKAHAHARKAAEETGQINWTQAAEEHQSAATDYARAAKSTADSEVRRPGFESCVRRLSLSRHYAYSGFSKTNT